MSNNAYTLYSVVYASGLITIVKACRRDFEDGTALKSFVAMAEREGTTVSYLVPLEQLVGRGH